LYFDPRHEKCPLPFSPFKSCTVPRPIGWLSSTSRTGQDNLAPYSQWQNISFDPAIIMFSANRYPDGRVKDTVLNAQDTGWFVWNMATSDLREAVNLSAMEQPFGVDEFDIAGVTKASSVNCAAPRVAESPVHFECEYMHTHVIAGDSPMGTADVVFARVAAIHIKDEFIMESGKIDIVKIAPLARLGYYDYTVVTDIFEMKIPNVTTANAAGLEGAILPR
jgi:flavin reductase (DIM6/NTAB) family NADH-FMN oxidoreductase RutF